MRLQWFVSRSALFLSEEGRMDGWQRGDRARQTIFSPQGSLFSRLGRKRERKTERKKESENPHGRKYRKRRAGLLGSLSRWLSPQQGCPASLLRHGCSAPRRRHSGDNRPSRDECWGFLPALTAAATASPFSSLLSLGLRLVGTAAALLLGFPTREDLCDGIIPSSSNPRALALLPSMARERVTAVHGRAEAEKDKDEKTDLGSDQRRGSGGRSDDRLKAPRGKVAKFFSGCRWQNRRRRRLFAAPRTLLAAAVAAPAAAHQGSVSSSDLRVPPVSHLQVASNKKMLHAGFLSAAFPAAAGAGRQAHSTPPALVAQVAGAHENTIGTPSALWGLSSWTPPWVDSKMETNEDQHFQPGLWLREQNPPPHAD